MENSIILSLFLLGFLFTAQQVLRLQDLLVYLLFVLAPILYWATWQETMGSDIFWWAKTFSVMAGVFWIMAYRRIGKFQTTRIGDLGVFLILFVNILEATAKDLLSGNIINGLAGVLLLISMPGFQEIYVESDKPRDLSYKLSKGWILGYTLWNITFVIANYLPAFGIHCAVLVSALIVGLQFPKHWFQARAFTLGVYLMFAVSYPNVIEMLRWEGWSQSLPSLIWFQGASLALMVAVVVREIGFEKRQYPIMKKINDWQIRKP